MAALLIINYGEVLDEDQLKAYRGPAAEVLVNDHGGAPTVSTNETTNLGEGHGAGIHTVALRYESVKAAQEAYESEAYQDLLGQRLASTRSGFAIVVPMVD